MRRQVLGLAAATQPEAEGVPDGLYLVQVRRVQHRWHRQKPFYALQLEVLEPGSRAGLSISARLYTTEKALWKLSWFLRDFGYDPELLSREEVDERALVGLRGVVRFSRTTWNGCTLVNLDAFAPAERWQHLAHPSARDAGKVAS